VKKNDDDSLLAVIKKATGVEKQKEISEILGLSPQDFNNRKKRGTLRPVLLSFAAEKGISITEPSHIVSEPNPEYSSLSQESRRLIDAYALADPVIKRAALKMLEDSAQESRGKEGVGSDCAGRKFA